MGKFKEFKEAMRKTPPERLAKIEYQSHFLQIIGISAVCVVLIVKGFWFIIFAFIFGVGISYSAGMSAYIKYNNIMALLNPEKVEEYQHDISPSRKRSKIINHVFGQSSKWYAIAMSMIASLSILGTDHSPLTLSLAYPITLMLLYIGFYFILFYWAAKPLYDREVKIE